MENIKSILWHLENRRSMYIDNSYFSLINFIQGYCICYRDFSKIDISANFQDWLRKKEGKYFALHWGTYILTELSNKNEQLAIEKLFIFWNEFIDETNENK